MAPRKLYLLFVFLYFMLPIPMPFTSFCRLPTNLSSHEDEEVSFAYCRVTYHVADSNAIHFRCRIPTDSSWHEDEEGSFAYCRVTFHLADSNAIHFRCRIPTNSSSHEDKEVRSSSLVGRHRSRGSGSCARPRSSLLLPVTSQRENQVTGKVKSME